MSGGDFTEYEAGKFAADVYIKGGSANPFIFKGTVTTATSPTVFASTDLDGLGNDAFAGWYVYVFYDTAGTGVAPQGEIQLISDYVSATGTFTHAAFTADLVVGDEVFILHESVAKMFLIADGAGAYPDSVVDNSIIGHILAIGGDVSDYNNATDSLEAISDKLATGAGTSQIAATTIDLNQVAATYDLLTGTTQNVLVESLIIRMPDIAGGGALTSISIQTDDSTPQVFVSSALGAVANLTAQAQLSSNSPIMIATGKKIQLTIAGGAHGVAYVCDVVVNYRAIIAGGTLV